MRSISASDLAGPQPVSECRCGVGRSRTCWWGSILVLVIDGISSLMPLGSETCCRTGPTRLHCHGGDRFVCRRRRLLFGSGLSRWGFTRVLADSMSSVPIDSIGSQVVAVDSNRVQINDPPVFVVETTPAEGLSGVFDVLPGDEVVLFSIGVTGDSIAALGQLDLEIGRFSVDTTFGQPISASDLAGLNLYRSADAAWDGRTCWWGSILVVIDGISSLMPLGSEVLSDGGDLLHCHGGDRFVCRSERRRCVPPGLDPAGGFTVLADSMSRCPSTRLARRLLPSIQTASRSTRSTGVCGRDDACRGSERSV